MTRTRVGVLVSGAGTNMTALAEAATDPTYPAEIVVVLCNRRDAGAIDAARQRGLRIEVLPLADFAGNTLARDHAMRDLLIEAGVQLVVCAGYNRVLSNDFIAAFPDAILNLHPSLLPAFGGGMHAVADALEAGARVSGCTVHFLEAGDTDGGAIILQAAVAVESTDDVASLRARIQEQEWLLLPQAVRLWSEGRLRREGKRIRILAPTEAAR